MANSYNIKQVAVAWLDMPVKASQTFYIGDFVMTVFGTSGYVVPGANTQYGHFLGVSEQNIVETTAVDGACTVRVTPKNVLKYIQVPYTSPTLTMVGSLMCLTGAQTVIQQSSSTYYVAAGRCVMVPDTSTTGSVIIDVLDSHNHVVNG